MRIHVPFAPARDAALPVKVTIPAEHIVFVEELPATDRHISRTPPAAAKPLPAPRAAGPIVNGGFESGDFTGWTADPNWKVDSNHAARTKVGRGSISPGAAGKGRPQPAV